MPAKELIDTLSFMRYRRNSLVHLNKVPSLAYQNLAARSGPVLNVFWTRVKKQLDFTVAAPLPLTEEETLDLPKLVRIVIRRPDTHFPSLIDERGLVQAEAMRLFSGDTRRINIESRIGLLRAHISGDYGYFLGKVTFAQRHDPYEVKRNAE